MNHAEYAERRAETLRLYRQGVSVADLGSQLMVTREQVWHLIHRAERDEKGVRKKHCRTCTCGLDSP